MAQFRVWMHILAWGAFLMFFGSVTVVSATIGAALAPSMGGASAEEGALQTSLAPLESAKIEPLPGERDVAEALRLLDYNPSTPFSEVVALLYRAARLGNAEAQFYMGVLHSFGLGVAKSEAKAVSYYTVSSMSGHAEAAVVLSHRFESGLGVPHNMKVASQFAKIAAEKVAKSYRIEHRQRIPSVVLEDIHSKKSSRASFGVSDEAIVQSHIYRSEQGSMESKMSLGYTYLYGLHSQGVDVPKAMRHFEDALEKRHPQAYGALGQIYMQGIDGAHPPIEPDQEKAFRLFEAGQALGDPVSLNGLGYFYARSATLRVSESDQEERFRKAADYYSRAASLGNADGTYNLAVLKLHGKGQPREPSAARSLFQVASGKGSLLASWQLGLLSMVGDAGMPQSDSTALRFLKDVMAKGPWNEHLRVAHGAFSAGNMRLALLEYLMASEMNLPTSRANALHILHATSTALNGVAVIRHSSAGGARAPLPRATAIEELVLTIILRSALEGDRSALLRLGDHYYTKSNFTRALTCYEQASTGGGLPQAMFNLGFMYQYGIGTAGQRSDFSTAKRYYDAALERSAIVSNGDAYYAVYGALLVLNFHYWLSYFESPALHGSSASSFSWSALPRPWGVGWDDWILGLSGFMSLFLLLLRNQVQV